MVVLNAPECVKTVNWFFITSNLGYKRGLISVHIVHF